MTKRRRGFTLIEILVVSGILIFVMLAAYAVLEVVRRSELTISARTDARAQVRNAFNQLALDLRRAQTIYVAAAPPSQSITLDGEAYVIVSEGVRGRNADSESSPLPETVYDEDLGIVFAYPKDDPPFPDTQVQRLYDVVAVKTIPRPQADSRNPDARSVLYKKWIDVATPNLLNANPTDIDLTSLGAADQQKVFDAYIPPGGLTMTLTNLVDAPTNSVAIEMRFEKQPLDGSLQTERHYENIHIRNN